MNVEVSRLPESRVALKIELSPEEVDQALERTYKQLVRRVNIPGFRKGKAPRLVVERLVGAESFLHEATDEAVRWGYRKAIDQESLVPIDQADIDAPEDEHAHLHPGQPFHFEATVAVKPEVELPDYNSIRIEPTKVVVADEDVDNLLHELQDRNATLEPIGRPAQTGDFVTMNVTAKVGGEEVVNEENADFELKDEEEAGPTVVFPGLSGQLVGASPGDIKDVTLPLPDTYGNEEWAGKTMFLRILVKEIKHKVLPDLTDEFAQSISEMQTLDEIRDTLRKNLEAERRLEADEALVKESVDALTSRTFVEIPPILIDEELDRMVDELKTAFGRQQFSLDLYLQSTGKSEDDLRNELREGATSNVKTSLVLGRLAEAEGIDASNKEIDRALEELFRTSRMSEPERRQLRSSSSVRSNIRTRIRRQRSIQKLVEIVTGGEEVSAEATEAVADQSASAADDAEEVAPVEIGG